MLINVNLFCTGVGGMKILKKIGIITHFYNSKNYGGLLQAYALSYYIKEQGCVCAQICFENNGNNPRKKRCFKIKNIHIYIRTLLQLCLKKFCEDVELVKIRSAAISGFRNSVPHSEKVYNPKNFKRSWRWKNSNCYG